jgi:hypothetical protein
LLISKKNGHLPAQGPPDALIDIFGWMPMSAGPIRIRSISVTDTDIGYKLQKRR